MKASPRLIALILALLAPLLLHADGGATYEVTVTNLTKGQIISAPVVASHNRHFSLFKLGEPAGPELAGLAEDAASGPLAALLMADPDVGDVAVASGGIAPGESVSVDIEARGWNRRISVAGMLVTTNDTFFAVRGLNTRGYGTRSALSPGYDAGSEENNELCAYIPGPPCGNGGERTESSEGFIHIQNGIHGIGDLDPSQFDWRNPVARVTVRRVH